MVQISDSLMWELTRKNTCFMKKVNGQTKRSGCIKFSVEPGNIKSLSKFKYSGIANSKAVGIRCTDSHSAEIITKTASKAHSQPKKGHVISNMKQHFRKTEEIIKNKVVHNFYRPDLKDEVLGKFSAVYAANRRALGLKKTVPVKKGRGKN